MNRHTINKFLGWDWNCSLAPHNPYFECIQLWCCTESRKRFSHTLSTGGKNRYLRLLFNEDEVVSWQNTTHSYKSWFEWRKVNSHTSSTKR
jgi:hypothetical protein